MSDTSIAPEVLEAARRAYLDSFPWFVSRSVSRTGIEAAIRAALAVMTLNEGESLLTKAPPHD